MKQNIESEDKTNYSINRSYFNSKDYILLYIDSFF